MSPLFDYLKQDKDEEPMVPGSFLHLPAPSIHHVLLDQADRMGDSVAIEFSGRTVTYAQAAERSRRFASGLAALGLARGDRVGVMMPNCPEFLYVYYGALMAGATVVMFNVMLTPDEIEYQLTDSGTRIVVVAESLRPALEQAAAKAGGLEKMIVIGGAEATGDDRECGAAGHVDEVLDFDALIEAGDPEYEPGASEFDEVVMIIYTSGTTGKPKGAMLTQANVLAIMASYLEMRPSERGERVLCVLPLFHVFGMNALLNMTMLTGGTLVLQPRFEAAAVIDALKNQNVTVFAGTPTMFFHILSHRDGQGAKFETLKRASCGGAPLPLEIRDEFRRRFGISMTEGYGLTESTVSLCGYGEGMLPKAGSVGVPVPGVELKIIDESGEHVALGDPGEICAKGPNIMAGYWNQPEATAETIRDGWLHTGDIGFMDDHGYVFVIDRKKDLIIKGGYNIYPREIEEIIYQVPQVNMAAVFGVPDAAKGELVYAVVSPRDGQTLTSEAIMRHLGKKLAKYKLPQAVAVLDQLPTGPTGKILRRELKGDWERIFGKPH